MRILHVVDSLERGGLERFVFNLVTEQRRAGDQPVVFSVLPTDGFRASIESAGVAVMQGGDPGRFGLSVCRRLRAAIASLEPDAIHTHGYVPNFYVAVASIGVKTKVPRTVTVHDMGARLENASLRKKFAWSLRSTRTLCAVSSQVRTALANYQLAAHDNIAVVYNGVPTPKPSTSRETLREAYDLPTDGKVLGTVGRLVALKNQKALIQAMPALIEAFGNDLRLVIAGSGPLLDELRQAAVTLGVDQQVLLTGEISAVDDLLSVLDLFVLPSHTEGLSMSLLEAGSAGLACVVTDVGGNSEIIQHDQTGLVVPNNNPPALFSAMQELLGTQKTG